MFQTILIEFLKDVPLLTILLVVLYFIYRELKQSDERILKEMRESDERILKEMRESDERILKEMRTTFERFRIVTFGIQETNMALLSSKNELTHEETLELYNFSFKIIDEFDDKYIEAYLFFHYACLMKYETLQA